MFLVQHGWGNGDGGGNVSRAIAAGDAAGVIWSACNYTPASVRTEIKRNAGSVQMLDPQLYVAYAPGDIKLLELPSYPWVAKSRDANGKRRRLTAQAIAELVDEALRFQEQIPELTEIVAPAPAVSAGTALQLNTLRAFAARAVSAWKQSGDRRPLFVSAPVEAGLLDAPPQEQLAIIGALTRAAPDGVYLLVELDPALEGETYANRLESALWITGRLAANVRVRVGYTGLNGHVFRAAGAEASASGWFQNRRFWSLRNWLRRSGGSRLERAALASPLALLAPADMAAIRDADANLYQRVVGGAGRLAATLRRTPATAGYPIALEDHAAQLFAVCAYLDSLVGRDFRSDARRIIAEVSAAAALRKDVARVALTIEGAATDGHPEEWKTALEALAKRLRIQL